MFLVGVLATAACGAPGPAASPTPSRSVPDGTVARLGVGDRVVITAAVDRRLDAQAFVVRDADLPVEGLLVLDPAATPVTVPQVITVHGVVIRFWYAEAAAGHGLHDPAAYQPFEGLKALTAERVEPRG